jgi:selenocysteine lyase/cysteine desulfurase
MTFPTREELSELSHQQPATILATNEGFWQRYALGYARDERFTQLNYGHYHPSLLPVLEAEIDAIRELNRRGSHFKRWQSAECLELARADLADLAGVSPEELILTRNSSEALNIVIQGLALAPGDEVRRFAGIGPWAPPPSRLVWPGCTGAGLCR